jgi:hypothetical protein
VATIGGNARILAAIAGAVSSFAADADADAGVDDDEEDSDPTSEFELDMELANFRRNQPLLCELDDDDDDDDDDDVVVDDAVRGVVALGGAAAKISSDNEKLSTGARNSETNGTARQGTASSSCSASANADCVVPALTSALAATSALMIELSRLDGSNAAYRGV